MVPSPSIEEDPAAEHMAVSINGRGILFVAAPRRPSSEAALQFGAYIFGPSFPNLRCFAILPQEGGPESPPSSCRGDLDLGVCANRND